LKADDTAPAPGDSFIVWYSGDGGLGRVERALAPRLASRGLPVVGVDSVRYFWRKRSPEAAAADLAAVIEAYATRWGRSRVIVAGYSFGAAAAPLIIARLPPQTRARVKLLVLAAPSPKGELTMGPWTWLEIPGVGATTMGEELDALGALPVLCMVDPKDRVARCPSHAGVEAIPVSGGHRLKGSYDVMAEAIAAAAAKAKPGP
jgi:type IV secretory pathway VirJ component